MDIAFVIPEGAHILDIAGPIQIFQEARDLGNDIHMSFLSANETVGSLSHSGLTLTAEKKVSEYQNFIPDVIFVPGIDLAKIQTIKSGFYKWISTCHREGSVIAGVCTGGFILGKAGLLDGKKCTTHWKYLDRLKAKYPSIKLQENRLFVQDENLYTTAGVASGIDLSLHLLEQIYSSTLAREVAKEAVIYFRRTEDDPQLSPLNRHRNHIEYQVHSIQDRIEKEVTSGIGMVSIEELAEEVNMSTRTLMRKFKTTVGTTIGKYRSEVRAEYVASLFKDGYSIEYIAEKTGISIRQVRRIVD